MFSNLSVKKLPDNNMYITGSCYGDLFRATLNQHNPPTGGVVEYFRDGRWKNIETISKGTLGHLLKDIAKATSNSHVDSDAMSVVLNALTPTQIYNDKCPECDSPVINGVCQGFACKERLL